MTGGAKKEARRRSHNPTKGKGRRKIYRYEEEAMEVRRPP